MPKKKLDGKDVPEEDGFWAEGSFAQTIGSKEMEGKTRTFYKKHDDEINYICKQCKAMISAHNRDWHNGLCDTCFDRMVGND